MKRSPIVRKTFMRSQKQNANGTRNAISCHLQTGGEVEMRVSIPTASGKLQRVAAPRRRKKRILRFGGVAQNPKYIAVIRREICIGLGLQSVDLKQLHVCSGIMEAAHTGKRGMRQKAVDESCLPMCSSLHRTGKNSHHKKPKIFWSFWGLDRLKLVLAHNERAREAGITVPEGLNGL